MEYDFSNLLQEAQQWAHDAGDAGWMTRREMARIETVLTEDTKGIRKLADMKTSILAESGSKDKKE